MKKIIIFLIFTLILMGFISAIPPPIPEKVGTVVGVSP